MPDARLIIPDEIEDLAIAVLKDRHEEHLAKVERVRGVNPGVFERFQTISHLSSDDSRVSGEALPAALLMVSGTSTEPEMTERNTLDAPLDLAVQVTVLGAYKRDTLRKRDVLAWTLIECLLQRLPLSDIVTSIKLVDYEPSGERDTQRILADARIVFEVLVPDMVTVIGGLPRNESPFPPGTPGGPPSGPYDPPVDLPQATRVTFDLERLPIVE